ncbi:hypothetical protein C8D99_10887 [Aminivibrio pyruvatiphilus]|jgi:hypothetical protein|uniref:Helix-turn-helix protein n=1 Tax=Aminivibrio pyruvatiphilus TaxID=1005740 RepID=A0A4R8M6T2_9BACT|nr:hypothetical protein C8D99_10887 [Aminivibrio pyruvatiphilus]
MMEKILTTAEMCEIFEVTDRTLRRWKNEDRCPGCLGKNSWSLFPVLEWWLGCRSYDAPIGAEEAIWRRLEKKYGDEIFEDYMDWSESEE